jgi:rubrerythrin
MHIKTTEQTFMKIIAWILKSTSLETCIHGLPRWEAGNQYSVFINEGCIQWSQRRLTADDLDKKESWVEFSEQTKKELAEKYPIVTWFCPRCGYAFTDFRTVVACPECGCDEGPK